MDSEGKEPQPISFETTKAAKKFLQEELQKLQKEAKNAPESRKDTGDTALENLSFLNGLLTKKELQDYLREARFHLLEGVRMTTGAVRMKTLGASNFSLPGIGRSGIYATEKGTFYKDGNIPTQPIELRGQDDLAKLQKDDKPAYNNFSQMTRQTIATKLLSNIK